MFPNRTDTKELHFGSYGGHFENITLLPNQKDVPKQSVGIYTIKTESELWIWKQIRSNILTPSCWEDIVKRHKTSTETERFLYAMERGGGAAIFATITHRYGRAHFTKSFFLRTAKLPIQPNTLPKPIQHWITSTPGWVKLRPVALPQ